MSMDIKGYETLASVLQAAYDQAAVGKGAERHATGLPFDQQPMQTGSDLLGTDAGLAFQAIKKIREGRAFEEYDRFERELLGAIVYIAGMIIWRQRHRTDGSAAAVPMFTEAGQTPPGCEWERQLRDAEVAWLDEDDEPAAQIDDESDRQQAVAQNGNDGAVYDDPWYGAPEWARFKAQDESGDWYWFSKRPVATHGKWIVAAKGVASVAHSWPLSPVVGWRDTLIERPVGQDPQE